ncbi:hypothetical protein [Terriglobus sp. ADX1]|uniref:hypothetical protein n=1 Tax=Terriglobus sp. ADX1 TaxID=2794063 RepID=UPI002FE64BDE
MITFSLLAWASPAALLAQGNQENTALSDESEAGPKRASKAARFWQGWASVATATQAKQPSWSVPLVSPFPMLAQVYRSDFTRQLTSAGTTTWSYGAGKGFNLIPAPNMQVDIYPPPYFQRNSATASDGWGDVGLLYKYRLVSRPEATGNYIVSAQVGASFPSGQHRNGAKYATMTPTILAGKGFGRRWNVLSSLGGTLPTSQAASEGRTVHFNSVLEFRTTKLLTMELEDNASFFHGGPNDGRLQNFITPGILLGRIKFFPDQPGSRTGIVLGAGMQFATSSWHSYDHNVVLSARFAF